ncbi:MAG: SDR family NAD(P)-dependent oxidoreductase, partial [Burkholderiaceae bacterium]|nr:SDR family NAD(P)-dependent oxidoreductase [Burkholderiaceae bacterium]
MGQQTGRMAAKRVLITGGANGLGLAIAQRFSAEGARIAICDINQEALDAVGRSHPEWLRLQCDVAQEPSVALMFERLRAALGGLDVLVNNAGIAGPTSPVEQIDPAAWQSVFNVNVFGTFL